MRTNARVMEITLGGNRLARSAVYYDSEGHVREQNARVIVVACNGIGTPRLLLNSRSTYFPDGLANNSGLVGKNLMFHPSTLVTGIFEERGDEYRGPMSSTMLSHQFYETDRGRGFVRGYQFQVTRSFGPLITAMGGFGPVRVPWGPRHRRAFLDKYYHSIGIVVMAEDLPEERNRVDLDPELTDGSGIAAPKVRYTIGENTARALDHGTDRAVDVMRSAGAREIEADSRTIIGGWHLLGTARMGDDPATSVVDCWGACHDVKNLFIVDGSVFVTSGAVNPTSTIQALALRTADYLKGEGQHSVAGG